MSIVQAAPAQTVLLRRENLWKKIATALHAWRAGAVGDRPGVFRPIFCRARSTSRRAWLGCSGRRPGWFRSAPRCSTSGCRCCSPSLRAPRSRTPYYVGWLRPAIDSRLTPFLNSFPGIGWTLLAIIWLGRAEHGDLCCYRHPAAVHDHQYPRGRADGRSGSDRDDAKLRQQPSA